MTTDRPHDPHDPFAAEHLDGHTLEELSDYLDAGRTPRDFGIEDSAGCQIALAALERLREASWTALDSAAGAEGDDDGRDESWVQGVMAGIVLDAHAGRDIPVPHPDPRVRLAVTEGAVRELVRSLGDDIPGILVGRVALVGDVETPGAPVSVELSATVRYGVPITEAAQTLRDTVHTELLRHTGIDAGEITVVVTDVHQLPEEAP